MKILWDVYCIQNFFCCPACEDLWSLCGVLYFCRISYRVSCWSTSCVLCYTKNTESVPCCFKLKCYVKMINLFNFYWIRESIICIHVYDTCLNDNFYLSLLKKTFDDRFCPWSWNKQIIKITNTLRRHVLCNFVFEWLIVDKLLVSYEIDIFTLTVLLYQYTEKMKGDLKVFFT